MIQSLGEQCDQVIGQMVLDGILAIEADGEMLSGPAARALVCADQPELGLETSLAALSRRALEYAEALEIADASLLSGRLYRYNHLPVSPGWRHLLPNLAAVENHLGIRNGTTARMLESRWARLPSTGEARGWIAWHARRAPQDHASPATYKLYVSPVCSELRAGFQAIVESRGAVGRLPLQGGQRCLRAFAAGQDGDVFPGIRRFARDRRARPGEAAAMPGARCSVHGRNCGRGVALMGHRSAQRATFRSLARARKLAAEDLQSAGDCAFTGQSLSHHRDFGDALRDGSIAAGRDRCRNLDSYPWADMGGAGAGIDSWR